MSKESENNKIIAKNTIYLFLRMLITMGVGLYTSRIVLNTLGISDYGIQNVMGGIIGMLIYVNSLLSGGTARFLTIDLGRGDLTELKKTFSMTNLLAFLSAIIILVLGETIGLWFMNTHLNIDPTRMEAANWVYQGALLSCCMTVLQTPYTASIIAHEKMDIYAYMSIFDVAMKLFIVYMLLWFDYDKLKVYACLTLLVNFLNFIIYRIICFQKFEECNMSFQFEKTKFKRMLTYSGWNMLGGLANLLNNYGLNILLNIFFGTFVNAARGIALQVSSIVTQFYSNFQTASRPQITKYYAQGKTEEMSRLICNNSKYSSLLLLCLIIPIATNIDGLLQVWLGQNPEHTSWFTRIILLQVLFQSIDLPIGIGIHAVGKMKLPNISSAMLNLCVFPLTYIVFKMGATPVTGYSIYLAFTPFILFIDAWILHKYTGFNRKNFIKHALIPIAYTTIIGCIFPISLNVLYPSSDTLLSLTKTICSGVYVCVIVLFVGVSSDMRKKLFIKCSERLRRL